MGYIVLSNNQLNKRPTVNYGTFSETSWYNISSACKSDTVPDTWHIGDEKSFQLNNGLALTVQIIGKNHDILTTPYSNGKTTAGLTLGLKNCTGTQYPITTYKNNNDWINSTIRTTTLPEYYCRMPPDLRNAIQLVNKKTASGYCAPDPSFITVASDDLFLLSCTELGNIYVDNITGIHEQVAYPGEGTVYEYYANSPIPPEFSEAYSGWFLGNGGTYIDKFGQSRTASNNIYYNINISKSASNDGSVATSSVGLRSPRYMSWQYARVDWNNLSKQANATDLMNISFAFCI